MSHLIFSISKLQIRIMHYICGRRFADVSIDFDYLIMMLTGGGDRSSRISKCCVREMKRRLRPYSHSMSRRGTDTSSICLKMPKRSDKQGDEGMTANVGRRRATVAAMALVAIAGFGQSAPAQERAIINNSQSPHSTLRSVDLSDVRWTDGFWKQKFDLVRNVTIPKMWEYYNGNGNSHWTNFRIAAGLEEGEWSGTNWHDGDLYKWIEAVAHVYMVTGDGALDQQMDEAIEVIGKVQEPDGYIWTRGSLEKRERFQHIHDHELYNMGHLMTAACIHHRATGKDSFLKIARKTGDCLYETFKDRKPELAHFGFNPSNIMGLVELYRTTGDRKYLDLANTFIDMRGSRPGPFRSTELGGTDQTQDRVPFRKAKEAVGHAVCGTYLYCGAADAFMETGDKTLLEALDATLVGRDAAQDVHSRRRRAVHLWTFPPPRPRGRSFWQSLFSAQPRMLLRDLLEHRQRDVELADVEHHRRGALRRRHGTRVLQQRHLRPGGGRRPFLLLQRPPPAGSGGATVAKRHSRALETPPRLLLPAAIGPNDRQDARFCL